MPAILSGRPARIVLTAGVLSALVGGGYAYADAKKTVTLSVDGQTRTVSSFGFGSTVKDVLAGAHVNVSDKDLVAPSTASDVHDGESIVVRYARPLQLTVDGSTRTVWTTANTVDGALSALGVRAAGADLSVSRSTPLGRKGLSVDVETLKHVSLTVDGHTRSIATTAATMRQVLADQKIRLASTDQLSGGFDTPLTDGRQATLTRIGSTTTVRTVAIGHATTQRSSADLYQGQTRVLQAGHNGVRTIYTGVRIVNGKATEKKIVGTKVTTAPQTRIVEVGTKARPVAAPQPAAAPHRSSSTSSSRSSSSRSSSTPVTTSTRSGGLNWAGLARCESGGNPRAVSPGGLYYGLYQFSVTTWRAMGGSGLPSQASPSEQTMRAQKLYDAAGAGQWPVCGKNLFS